MLRDCKSRRAGIPLLEICNFEVLFPDFQSDFLWTLGLKILQQCFGIANPEEHAFRRACTLLEICNFEVLFSDFQSDYYRTIGLKILQQCFGIANPEEPIKLEFTGIHKVVGSIWFTLFDHVSPCFL
jgi:hypothetical protein